MVSIARAASDHQNLSRSGDPLPSFDPGRLSVHKEVNALPNVSALLKSIILSLGRKSFDANMPVQTELHLQDIQCAEQS